MKRKNWLIKIDSNTRWESFQTRSQGAVSSQEITSYCYRKLHTYSHHGIYVEEDRVIHYTLTQEENDSGKQGKQCKNCGHHSGMAGGGVVKTCVDCFLKGHRVYLFEYGVSPRHFMMKNSGTCTTGCSDPAEVSISRATDLLMSNKGFGEYNLFNNCESFAIYCKTNKHMSNQAFSAINSGQCAAKAFMKHNMDRLLNDVLVRHPHKHKHFEETTENSVTLPLKQIIGTLRKLNTKEGGDQDEDVDEDQFDEYLENMEENGGNDAQLSVS